MKREYAFEAFNCMGKRVYWADAYPDALTCRKAAGAWARERGLGYTVHLLRKEKQPEGYVGATWIHWRTIKNP